MGETVHSNLQGGLPAASGGGFSLPLWVYLVIIGVGVALTILFLILSASAKRRASAPSVPGAPPPLPGTAQGGGGSGFLIAGIASLVVLVVAPVIVMVIMKPWQDNWIVGRWSQYPGCAGQTIEFTSDGRALENGDTQTYRLEGDQITMRGQTTTVQHDDAQFTVNGLTAYRCR